MSSVETPSVVGADVVSMTVVGAEVVSTTVVFASVVGLAVVTASVVGDIVLDIVSLDISQLTPEKPGKQPCMSKAFAQHFKSMNNMLYATAIFQYWNN